MLEAKLTVLERVPKPALISVWLCLLLAWIHLGSGDKAWLQQVLGGYSAGKQSLVKLNLEGQTLSRQEQMQLLVLLEKLGH